MSREDEPTRYSFLSKISLVLTAFFLLPAVDSFLFGWMSGITGVPVFYLLYSKGQPQAFQMLRNSLLLAAVLLVLLGKIETLFFSITFIPLGYTIYKSNTNGESISLAGAKGVAVLGLCWLAYWIIQGTLAAENPYLQLLHGLDAGFTEMISLYGQQQDLSADTAYALTSAFSGLKKILPLVLPGILGSILATTVLVNLVIINLLAQKTNPSVQLWGEFKTWALPDSTVWLPIISAGIMLIADNGLQIAAVSAFIIGILLFFFQGLAVLFHLLDRWKIPTALRLLIYGMLIIQSYGLLLLAALGISEVWLDIRNRFSERPEQ